MEIFNYISMQFVDQLNRNVVLASRPKRIVSLVPSLSELLYDLDLMPNLVGITKFCVYPTIMYSSVERIGGTKNPKVEKIKALEAHIVFANKEENNKVDIEQISSFCPVWVSDVNDLTSALEMIEGIGDVCDCSKRANSLVQNISYQFADLAALVSTRQKLTCAYLIWREPLMVAGNDTFINAMLKRCGLVNVFSDKQRYPTITAKDLQKAAPAVILLSSEPYPFKAKHVAFFKALCPLANICLVDGTYFSWYGSRLANATTYFKKLVYKLSENK